jgi:putative ABC transport system permease protein
MAPGFLKLGWRTLLRDLRAGELRLLIVAVTLAVAALTAVGFFADRLQGGLARDARQLLGGDAVVVGDTRIPAEFALQARGLGLQTVQTLSFPTMARADSAQGGASKLVALKVVPQGYPLRGRLRVAKGPDQPDAPTSQIPQTGEAWLARMIVIEPDRGAGFMSFAPRVMLTRPTWPPPAWCSRPAASPGAWRWPATGASDAPVKRLRAVGRAHMAQAPLRGVRVESLESGRPEMRQTLDRAEKFLNLVALLAALLAAVAVGIAARDFAAPPGRLRHAARAGLSQRALPAPMRWSSACRPAGQLAGVLLGLGVHNVFVWLLPGLVDAGCRHPGLWPALFGLGVG